MFYHTVPTPLPQRCSHISLPHLSQLTPSPSACCPHLNAEVCTWQSFNPAGFADVRRTNTSHFVGCIKGVSVSDAIFSTAPATSSAASATVHDGSTPRDLAPPPPPPPSTVILPTLYSSRGVKVGCVSRCSENPFYCLNGGKCINYYVDAQCDCYGTGFEGQRCHVQGQFTECEIIKVSSLSSKDSKSLNSECVH